MVKWAKKLYFSDNIKKRQKKIIKSIKANELTFEIYVITFAQNTENLFDIINANELKFPYYSSKDIYIIGLADSRAEAKELVRDMIEEIYNKTGEFFVREYF